MTPRIRSYKANQLLLSAGHVEVTLADYPHNSGTAGSSEVLLLDHYSTRSIFKYPDTFDASHFEKDSEKKNTPSVLPSLLPRPSNFIPKRKDPSNPTKSDLSIIQFKKKTKINQ